MSEAYGKIVQLCGPVSGLSREEAMTAFDEAKERCWVAGATIVWSPVDHVPCSASHETAMHLCLTRLLDSPYVNLLVTLPGWERSRGASLEVAVAKEIGVEVMGLEEAVA